MKKKLFMSVMLAFACAVITEIDHPLYASDPAAGDSMKASRSAKDSAYAADPAAGDSTMAPRATKDSTHVLISRQEKIMQIDWEYRSVDDRLNASYTIEQRAMQKRLFELNAEFKVYNSIASDSILVKK